MSARIDLACAVCTAEFVIPVATYVDHSQVVQCLCCGTTDLVTLALDEAVMLTCRIIAA